MITKIPLNDLVRTHAPIQDQIDDALLTVARSGRFIGGESVVSFERELARYLGVAPSRVVTCSSGTDALMMALMALDVAPGKRVAVPAFTFGAPAMAVARLGATPVFVDIDPETYTIDVARLHGLELDGVIAVHLFGRCVDMTALNALAKTNGWFVIEDAAQAIGATHADLPAGTMSDFGCFSFFPTKNLGALGDGGAVIANSDESAEALRAIRHHGSTTKYVHDRLGGNFRLDALQAAVLRVKLPHLEAWNERRRDIASIYLGRPADRDATYHRFVVRSPRRDALQNDLRGAGIETAIYYPKPLHRMPCFRSDAICPVADHACDEVLALPLFPSMTEDEVARVNEWVPR